MVCCRHHRRSPPLQEDADTGQGEQNEYHPEGDAVESDHSQHHDDDIHMTQRILEQSEHAELVELAQAIINAQTAENAQMEALIATLSS